MKKIFNILKDINGLSFFVLIIYPIILAILVVEYPFARDTSMFSYLWLIVIGYYGANISVGVGVHRLWSHASYKTNKYVEFILMMLFAGTLQGPILSWVSNHIDHHKFTDTDKDPHSPLKYKNSKLLGFFWSHIGWMLVGEGSYKSINRVVMKKLGRNKILKFQLRYYWQCAIFMNLVFPFLLGILFSGGDVFSGYSFVLFIGVGRAVQQEMTFFVNSLCHIFGTKYYTNGTSRDIWWLSFLLLGENWHNFHHAFPSDYRNGSKWYHLDVHKWIIFSMKILGLAKDLHITPKSRILAKMNQVSQNSLAIKKERFVFLENKINELLDVIESNFTNFEDKSCSIKFKIQKSKEYFFKKLSSLKFDLGRFRVDLPSEEFLDAIAERINKIEIFIGKVSSEIKN